MGQCRRLSHCPAGNTLIGLDTSHLESCPTRTSSACLSPSYGVTWNRSAGRRWLWVVDGVVALCTGEVGFSLVSQDHAYPLMQGRRNDVENPLFSIMCSASGLLDEQCHRICFIHEAKTRAAATARVCWVEEDATSLEDAVDVGHHRGGPAHIIILAQWPLSSKNSFLNIICYSWGPLSPTCHIDRELTIALGHLQWAICHAP